MQLHTLWIIEIEWSSSIKTHIQKFALYTKLREIPICYLCIPIKSTETLSSLSFIQTDVSSFLCTHKLVGTLSDAVS